ncbi:MAG: tetratricopeptide repeat protein [Planctomycetota bacterium]
MSVARERPPAPQRPLIAAGLLVAAVCLAYLPVWSAGFLWDDDVLITENDAVRSADGLADLWTGRGQLDYFPLTSSLYWLEWRAWGADATGYHVVNVALHALAVLLVWRVLLALRVRGAWLAASLFALHPVGVASVAWIAEGKNTLSLVFLAGSLLAWLRSAESRHDAKPRAGGSRWLALSALLFACSLLCKTALVPAPFVFLLCVWWRWGRLTRADLRAALPLLMLSIVLGLVTLRFQHAQDMGSLVVRPEGFLSRLAVAGRALWFYAGKLAWPSGLSAVYPRWEVAGTSPVEHLPGLLWCGVLFAAWRARAGWGRPVLFAVGSATLLVAPALGFVTMTHHALSLVADHFQYVSMIALLALAASAAATHWPAERRAVGLAVAALVVAGLGVLSARRAADWSDVESLSRALVAQRETSWFGHANLGSVLLARGDDAQAAVHLARAVELNPLAARPLLNLAELRARAGDLSEAEVFLRRAIAAHPALAEAHAKHADVLIDLGRVEEAERAVREALRLQPQDTTATLVQAKLLLASGDAAGAETLCRRAVAARPERADAHNRLGFALVSQGRDREAEQAFTAALALDPMLPEALNNLGVLHARRGETESAAQLFRRALEARPGYDRARANLDGLSRN